MWRALFTSAVAALLLSAAAVADAQQAREDMAAVPLEELHYKAGEGFPSHIATMSDGCPVRPKPIVGEGVSLFRTLFAHADEGPLPYYANGSPGQTQLRFVWYPSFHDPIIVRLLRNRQGNWLITAKSVIQMYFELGPVNKVMQRELLPQEGERLELLLAETKVFQPPYSTCYWSIDEDGREALTVVGDGDSWVFEMIDDRGYRFDSEHSPVTGDEQVLGQYLVGLAGWDVGQLY